MALKHLNDGERVVFSTRTHAKALIVPALVFLLVVAIAVLLSLPASGVWVWVVWALAAIVLVRFTLWPTLEWAGATYTVTDRRLITRSGVLTRRGHDIPLNRISDVSSERGVLDRMLGCGTLVVADASTHGHVTLPDVPDVERLQLLISEQLSGGGERDDDGA